MGVPTGRAHMILPLTYANLLMSVTAPPVDAAGPIWRSHQPFVGEGTMTDPSPSSLS